MSTQIRVPQLPESVADATLVTWHKKPGDAVKRDENLADLETDKVVLEVPAPANGVLKELVVAGGTTVTSGQVLAILDETAAGAAARPASAGTNEAVAQTAGVREAAQRAAAAPARAEETMASARSPSVGSASLASPASASKEPGKLSPSARRLVEENGLDAGQIPASGRDGRVTKSDVVDFLGRQQGSGSAGSGPSVQQSRSATPHQQSRAPQQTAAREPAQVARGAGDRSEQRVAMTRLRQRIAQRMVEAQSTQALLTSFNEVDLTAIQALRTRYKDRFEKDHGVKLGFMSFFVKASVEGLKKFPVVNASVDGNEIVYHDYYDIGVAVSTERGLMVPVVRDADLKSFAQIEKEISAYATQAREGSIAIEDLTGGTFTVTNGGVFGSLLSTPIVNAPQSAILGMHKIQERPVVVDGQIVVRPMMYLAVTYDHRIIDGREAVQFLVTIKESLEDPSRMLLGL